MEHKHTPEEHTIQFWKNCRYDANEEKEEAEDDVELNKEEFYDMQSPMKIRDLKEKGADVLEAMREVAKLEYYVSLCDKNISLIQEGRLPDMNEWHDRDMYDPDIKAPGFDITDEEDTSAAVTSEGRTSNITADNSKDVTYVPSQEVDVTPDSKRQRTTRPN
jgi:hypothetical protein